MENQNNLLYMNNQLSQNESQPPPLEAEVIKSEGISNVNLQNASSDINIQNDNVTSSSNAEQALNQNSTTVPQAYQFSYQQSPQQYQSHTYLYPHSTPYNYNSNTIPTTFMNPSSYYTYQQQQQQAAYASRYSYQPLSSTNTTTTSYLHQPYSAFHQNQNQRIAVSKSSSYNGNKSSSFNPTILQNKVKELNKALIRPLTKIKKNVKNKKKAVSTKIYSSVEEQQQDHKFCLEPQDSEIKENEIGKVEKNDYVTGKGQPPKLVEYVERCFEVTSGDSNIKAKVSLLLKSRIEKIVNEAKNIGVDPMQCLSNIDQDCERVIHTKDLKNFRQELAQTNKFCFEIGKVKNKSTDKKIKSKNVNIEGIFPGIGRDAQANLSKAEKIKELEKQRQLRQQRFGIVKKAFCDDTAFAFVNSGLINRIKLREEKKNELGTEKDLIFNLQDFSEYESDFNQRNKNLVVGLSQQLEKPYLRLTSEPDLTTIRPLSVLREAFDLIHEKYWLIERNYARFSEQMKSIRQDLSVQHIRTEFTLMIYETNAKICLEVGDLSEFNQCQSQLVELYKDVNFSNEGEKESKNFKEFLTYRLLYYALIKNSCSLADTMKQHQLYGSEYGSLVKENNNQASMETSLQSFSDAISQSIQIARCRQSRNFVKFFRLYRSLKYDHARMLLNTVLDKIRLEALIVVCRSYITIPITKLVEWLGFDSISDCYDYINDCGIVFTNTSSIESLEAVQIDCRASKPFQYRCSNVSKDSSQFPNHTGVTHGSFHQDCRVEF